MIEKQRAARPLLAIEDAHIFAEEGGFQLFSANLVVAGQAWHQSSVVVEVAGPRAIFPWMRKQ